jgi:hypothetical protein
MVFLHGFLMAVNLFSIFLERVSAELQSSQEFEPGDVWNPLLLAGLVKPQVLIYESLRSIRALLGPA